MQVLLRRISEQPGVFSGEIMNEVTMGFRLVAMPDRYFSNLGSTYMLSVSDEDIGQLRLASARKFASGEADVALVNDREFHLKITGKNFFGAINRMTISEDRDSIWEATLLGIMARTTQIETQDHDIYQLKRKSIFSYGFSAGLVDGSPMAEIARTPSMRFGAVLTANCPEVQLEWACFMTWIVVRLWILSGSS